MKKVKVSIKKIIKKFNINIVNKDVIEEYGYVEEPAIKRLGLEIANKIDNKLYYKNIICWGTSESEFFEKSGKTRSVKTLERVLSVKPPLVILSKGVNDKVFKWVLEVCNKFQIPLYRADTSTSKISSSIGTYLNDYYSEQEQVHGCLVSIGGVGVLIIGPSGAGKSEATLELIQRGHMFISDDAVLVKHIGSHFYGTSPVLTKNFIEVRGIGLIDIKYTYGIKSIMDGSVIDLVIELVPVQNLASHEFDRLGLEYLKHDFKDGSLIKTRIPVRNGSSVASLIEAAVSAYLARRDGLDVIEIINERSKEMN